MNHSSKGGKLIGQEREERIAGTFPEVKKRVLGSSAQGVLLASKRNMDISSTVTGGNAG